MTATRLPPSATRAAATGAPARARRRAYDPTRRRSTLLTVLLWLCGLYFAAPLVWLVISSTKSTADLFSTFGYAFGHFDLIANVASVFSTQHGVYTQWLINTVFYAGASAVGAAALSTMAGYAFAKYDFPGSRFLFSVTLGAIMIPLTALAIPTYLLFSAAGLTNTPLAVIVPSLVSPFGVYLIRVFAADAIPDSLMEAARVDGGGEFRIFWQIGIRMLSPGILTVFLFALVATWNNYFLPLIMLSNSGLYPITVGLAQWQSTSSTGGGGSEALFTQVITGSLISVLPIIVAFLFLQRYWATGLATGGVKG